MEGAALRPDLLAVAGEALFGPEWRRPLASALDVDPRLIQRWAVGQRAIPPEVAPALLTLLWREATGLKARAQAMLQAAEAIQEVE